MNQEKALCDANESVNLMKQRKLKGTGNPRLIVNRVVERKRELRVCMFELKLNSRFKQREQKVKGIKCFVAEMIQRSGIKLVYWER